MRNTPGGSLLLTRAATLLLAALAAACGGDRQGGGGTAQRDTSQEPGGTPERGGTAVLVEAADMEKPMPLVWQSTLDSDLMDVMYMGLTRAEWRDGRLVYLTSNDNPMAAAYHWEYSGPDSTAMRFRLRSGLKWSDGQPLTAADVVYTYQMMANPAVASPRQGDVEQIDSVTAENDSTVVIHYKRRYADMMFSTAASIVPRHVYQDAAPGSIRTHPALNDPANRLVVSGAFKVGAWRRGESITLVPNPYFPVQPRLDRIVIRIIGEPTTRLVELRNGTADMVRGISFDQVPQIRAGDPQHQIRIEREQGRFWEYIAYLPSAHPAFADPAVRRALGMSIDVPAIIRALQMQEWTTQAAGPYSPIFKGLGDDPAVRPLAYDTARADSILDARGWKDTNGDGIRDKDGRALSFTLQTNSGNARRADVTQIVQQQWKKVGVDAQLRALEFNTFQNSLSDHKYQAALGSWGVQLSPDITPEFMPGAQFNIVQYNNPEVVRLMQEALAKPTYEQSYPLWRAAAERIVQDQPYTWLYYYDAISAVRNRLRGVRINTYGAYQNVWEWWIPRSLQGAAPGGAAPAGAGNDTAKGKR
jgi:peptide/nickel transport system substrate-binding protein